MRGKEEMKSIFSSFCFFMQRLLRVLYHVHSVEHSTDLLIVLNKGKGMDIYIL